MGKQSSYERINVEEHMTTNLVLTVIADDKPGLVESLAQIIASNSGNWLESSMSQLAGKFAGILRVSVDEERVEQLLEELNGLSSEIKLVIEKAVDESVDRQSQIIELNLVGNDRPGIIKEISAAVAALGINVQRLNTECTPAPMSSDALFKAEATLEVPEQVTLEQLQDRPMGREMLSEVKGIMQQFTDFNIQLWCFDTSVYSYAKFDSTNIDDIDTYEIVGGGGTDFMCNWKYMEENDIQPQRFVMFTDGMPWDSWGDENYCDTVFIIHGSEDIKPPFGNYAYYDMKDK